MRNLGTIKKKIVRIPQKSLLGDPDVPAFFTVVLNLNRRYQICCKSQNTYQKLSVLAFSVLKNLAVKSGGMTESPSLDDDIVRNELFKEITPYAILAIPVLKRTNRQR